MIRVVVAGALAAALLGVSLPAVADARADRTAAALDRAALGVDRAARDLSASEPAVAPGDPGARRVVRVEVPTRSLTRAAVEFVALCPAARPADPGRVVYALDGRPPVVRRLTVPLDGSVGPVVLRDPGVHRVALERVRVGGTTAVRATAGGRPTAGGTTARGRAGAKAGAGSSRGTRPPAPCETSSTASAGGTTTGRATADRGSEPRPAPRTTA